MTNQQSVLSTEKKLLFYCALILILSITSGLVYLGYTVFRSIEIYSYIKSSKRGWQGKVFKTDTELGFAHVPDVQGLHVFPVGPPIPMRFDKNGFRVPVGDTPAESNGRPLVLALGCSFTYGDAVYARDTYPYLVGQALRGTTKNAGCCSCGLSQMLILAGRLIPSHKPDYLIVQYSPWLISRSLSPFAPTYGGKSPGPYFYGDEGLALHPPVFLTNLANLPLESYRNTPKSIIDFISFLWNAGLPQFIYDDFNMSRYTFKRAIGVIPKPATDENNIVRYVYEEIASLARKNGSRLIIVVLGKSADPVPVPTHLFPSDSIIVDAHTTLLERLSIVNDEHYKKAYAHWRGSPPTIVDTHPNEKAHQIIADEILSKIKNRE